MKVRLGAACAAALFVLVACGGGGSGSGVLSLPAVHASATPSIGKASVQLVIPTAATAAVRGRKPAFVSPATQSALVTAAGASVVLDLSASSSNCTTNAQGRVCSANLSVPFGSVTISIATYDQAPVNGVIPNGAHKLGTGSVTQTIGANTSVISIAIDAVVNGIGTLASSYSWPADGLTRTYGFVLNPVDFDNAPIANHANDPFANPITVTLSEHGGSGHAHLQLNGAASGTSATLQSAADSISVVYDGGGSPGYYANIAFAATGVGTTTITRSPLFVSTSTIPSSYSYSNFFLQLGGPPSTATFTIDEANASGVTYSATPVNCTNIASVTQPALQSGVEQFSVTGGTVASGGGCTISVSDSMSTIAIGVSNAPPGVPTPTPTMTPTLTPSPTPSPTPTATPSPTPTPLITPPPLGPSLYVANGNEWVTYPIAAVTAASPNPYNAAPQTVIVPTSGFTPYFSYDPVHNMLWTGNGGFPASWNGSIAGPTVTLMPTGVSPGGGSGVDASGNLYQGAFNSGYEYILIYPSGQTVPGTIMQMPLSVQSAHTIKIDSAGYIYISDNGGHAVDVISNPGPNAGSVIGTVTRTITGFAGSSAPWGLALDSTGRIYATDPNGPSGVAYVFAAGTTNAAQATPIETIASSAFGGTPEDLAIDGNDNLWLTDGFSVLEVSAGQISTNLGGSVTYPYNKISGAATQLSSPTAIFAH